MNRRSKGFTLIELLIVIAVIAILATVIITNFGSARARARYTAALTSMQDVTNNINACFSLDGYVMKPLNADGTDNYGKQICYKEAALTTAMTEGSVVYWPNPGTGTNGKKWGMSYDAVGNIIVSGWTSYSLKLIDDVTASKTITCNKNGCSAAAGMID